nr:hypothetical protein [Kibdelosporangium sp. MJ126-NF4]CEL17590.1 hypothetical protein [Kibdelosporangium sp. MJ126-NF4]CTQ91183.1 hypothetical protein [Kibdelosporangium sp. MJ126-NF4]
MNHRVPGDDDIDSSTVYELRQMKLVEDSSNLDASRLTSSQGEASLWFAVCWTWMTLGSWFHMSGSLFGSALALVGGLGAATVLLSTFWRRHHARHR